MYLVDHLESTLNTVKDIQPMFQESILKDISQIYDSHMDSEIYAVALLCNDGLTNFFIALSSKENLSQVIQEEDIFDDEEEILYYQWSPNEWLLTSHDLPTSNMAKLNEKIYEIYKIFSDANKFIEFKKLMFEMAVQTLSAIQDNIRELLHQSEIPIFLSFTDASRLEEIQNYTSKCINPSSIHQKFKDRFNKLEWGRNLGELNPVE